MTDQGDRGPVLIGFDGLDDAEAAIRGAGALLAPRPAIVAHVWESLATLLLRADTDSLTGTMKEASAEFDAGEAVRAEEVTTTGVRLATEAGFDARGVVARGKPKAWPTLIALADEHDAAAIVVGSEGLGTVKSALLGSVSSGLVHHSRRPVLIVPRDAAEPGAGPVILAYDGSDESRRGIEAAAGLFAAREAIVSTVWVPYETVASMGDIGMPAAVAVAGAREIDSELAEKAAQTAEEGAAIAREAGMDASAEPLRELGNTSGTLIDSAREHEAAAIVVGSHGRGTMGVALLGSVAMGLVHHCPVPLLVVPCR
ncbi:MAG: universal stress protein [Thermoleophilaceae bacterium]|nr:universal stress protein [Thermoleophilaceae bacterium]